MRTAVLVLDIQEDFVGPHARMPVAHHHIEPMLHTINVVIDKVHAVGIPIVYIKNEFKRSQWIANWFRHDAAREGSHGAILDKRLRVVNDLQMSKNVCDAFSNPRLAMILVKERVEHIIIMGLFAEACIATTAKGAKKRGYQVTVLQDAVASMNDRKREKALAKLAPRGIAVTTSQGFMDGLGHSEPIHAELP